MIVSLTTLGCKANQYDTEAIAESFRRSGHQVVPFPEPAEVYVINTCSVTQEAARKSRQLARRALRANPGAAVVLTGCYAQTGEDAAALPGVGLVVGPQDRGRIVELVQDYLRTGTPRRIVRPRGSEPGFIDLPLSAFGEHTRAWLKIQDGCDQFCAYCQIPLARGPSRSLPIGRVLEEAERLVASGYRELVLTGIHLGAYGTDLPGRPDLALAVNSLKGIEGLLRLRLGSIEPDDVTPRLIEALASLPAACPHLHLPLQSGNDAVLAAMRRPYRTRDFLDKLDALRRAIPSLAVSTDLMVGFPGETEEQFSDSLRFVSEAGFSRLHVFPFSARPGTAAARLPGQLPRRVREERSQRATVLSREIALGYNRTLIGRIVSVLVEECRAGTGRGLAGEYVETIFPVPDDIRNDVVPIMVTDATPTGVFGRLADRP